MGLFAIQIPFLFYASGTPVAVLIGKVPFWATSPFDPFCLRFEACRNLTLSVCRLDPLVRMPKGSCRWLPRDYGMVARSMHTKFCHPH